MLWAPLSAVRVAVSLTWKRVLEFHGVTRGKAGVQVHPLPIRVPVTLATCGRSLLRRPHHWELVTGLSATRSPLLPRTTSQLSARCSLGSWPSVLGGPGPRRPHPRLPVLQPVLASCHRPAGCPPADSSAQFCSPASSAPRAERSLRMEGSQRAGWSHSRLLLEFSSLSWALSGACKSLLPSPRLPEATRAPL